MRRRRRHRGIIIVAALASARFCAIILSAVSALIIIMHAWGTTHQRLMIDDEEPINFLFSSRSAPLQPTSNSPLLCPLHRSRHYSVDRQFCGRTEDFSSDNEFPIDSGNGMVIFTITRFEGRQRFVVNILSHESF